MRNHDVYTLKMNSRRLPAWFVRALRSTFEGMLGFTRANKIYRDLPQCEAIDFAEVLLKANGIAVDVPDGALAAVPETGPLIVVANHPFGLAEGLALDASLTKRRHDVTIMANHWLAAVPECAERYLFVDPQQSRRHRKLSPRGWRRAYQWIKGGGVILIFPAGRVARFRLRQIAVTDMPWSPHVARLARQTGSPVLPVFVHGRCSIGFYLLGTFFPALQDTLAIREAVTMRGQTVRATVGQMIDPTELRRFSTDEEAIAFLRERTLALAHQ